MRKKLIIALMTLSALPSMAQIDLHSHAITQGYLEYIKANGAEMDEGFPIPSWDAKRHIAFMDKARPPRSPCLRRSLSSAMRRPRQRCAADTTRSALH